MSIPDPIVLLDARAKYVHPAFQMTRASTKTVFDATGKLVTVPANALGWDHNPATGQVRGYLSEPQATNLLLYSNDLTQSGWARQRTSIAAGIVGPDGQSMAKLVEGTETGAHYLRQTVNIQAGEVHCYSAIVKAAERTQIYFWVHTQEGNRIEALFNLSGGTYNTTTRGEGVVFGAGAIDIGGGFFRVWISGTLGLEDDTAGLFTVLRHQSGGGEYEGDGTSGIYLGYFQVEEGSYPTSYIETGGATATRAADSLVLSGLGDFPWWAGQRGTVFIEYQLFGTFAAGHFFEISDGQLEVRFNTSGTGVICAGAAVESAVLMQPQQARTFTRKKHAFTFDAEEFASVWNGGGLVSGARSAPFTYPASLTLASGPPVPGHIMRAVYYPARLSNADLQSLTAIQE